MLETLVKAEIEIIMKIHKGSRNTVYFLWIGGNMKRKIYNKIKRNLYNYNKTEELIKEREEELIWRSNGSNEAYLRGINQFNNSLENQIVKLCDDKRNKKMEDFK